MGVVHRMGISKQAFYYWKKLYAGFGVGERRRLMLLQQEDRKLKQLFAGLSCEKRILQDVLYASFQAFSLNN